ncbi:hypothetical protein O4J56_13680 [Nocardiopsis sp. RSe5-2]|uniref:Uncharacterized protein n=1 Tax=Nocardiopsis endophytica TaxID=3018445 RepID=A0ABT4U4Q2_9ACTN|nr:hypothetical protein [Nocardiopsis endophytica]MDA2811686.1 hypothetical protein [Nocardiopsis endophytica]
MSLVYRSIATVDLDRDITGEAAAALAAWLSRRGPAGARVDFSRSGSYELSKRSRAMVVRHDNREDRITFLRLTTESDKADGRWRTTATIVSDPQRLPHGYSWVDMTADPRHELSGTDRLDIVPPDAVRLLLERLPCRDGGQRLASEPAIVRGRDAAAVQALADAIADPARRLAVVVFGPPADMTVAAWRDAMAAVLSRSAGMCAGYVLDAAAHERLSALLPPSADVPAGGVRTFLPCVDPDDWTDAQRHPRMSAHTLDAAREGARVRPWVSRALARSVRDTAVDSPLPAELRAIDTLLNEEELDAYLREQENGAAAAPVAPATTGPHGTDLVPLLKSRLADQARDAERLRSEAKRLSVRSTEQAKERERLAAELADATEELHDARAALHAVTGELKWLRERLHEEGLHRLAVEEPPPDRPLGPPRTVEELLERITDRSNFPHLYFTIEDRDTVRELTGSRKEKLWVTRAWEALLALDDYARYQLANPGSGLGFHDYLREPPNGYRAVPVKRLASRESDTVRNRDKLSDKRVFKVPEEVSPTREVPMYAHIKLDSEYGICPRLYFYSDLGPGTTNRIYIGYLGRHLPVQGTN